MEGWMKKIALIALLAFLTISCGFLDTEAEASRLRAQAEQQKAQTALEGIKGCNSALDKVLGQLAGLQAYLQFQGMLPLYLLGGAGVLAAFVAIAFMVGRGQRFPVEIRRQVILIAPQDVDTWGYAQSVLGQAQALQLYNQGQLELHTIR
jgi:hypothetical protein